MKKAALFAITGCLMLGTWAFFGPCCEQDDTASLIPEDRKEYVTRVNAYQAVISRMGMVMRWKEEKRASGRVKTSNPEMFALFDKMKRINPNTGELPANGILDALNYIEQEWGSMSTQRTGYSLQWTERGPNNIGGRTRALMWDPNDPTNRAAFAGGVGGGLWYNSNVTSSATTWVQVSPTFSNVAVTCITVDPNNPLIMYYGTGEGWGNVDQLRGAGIWKSVDGGQTWNHLPSTDPADFWTNQDIAVAANGSVYASTKAGLFRSDDAGATFTKVLGSGVSNAANWMTDFEIAGNGDFYVAIHSGGIYKSAASLGANQGTIGNWTRLLVPFPGGYDRVEVAVGKNNSNYIYTVCEVNQGASNIIRSTDAGVSWSATNGQPGGQFSSNDQAWYDLCLEVDPTNHLTVYTGAIDQHRSTTGGSSWSRLTAAYSSAAPYMHPDQHAIVPNPANPLQLLYGHDGGVSYSTNRGSNPSERNRGYNVTQFYSLAISTQAGSSRIIGGTQDNGSIMQTVAGMGAGTDLTGGDGAYCAIYPGREDTMFTTSQWETLYRSKDGGNNFNYIANPALSQNNTMFINPIEIDPFNPNVLYQASNSLWRHGSATSGGSNGWSQISVQVSQITAITPTLVPSNTVYFAAGGSIYRIDNTFFAGSTTVPQSINPTGMSGGYINCILADPTDGDHLFVPFSSYGVNQHVVEITNAGLGSGSTLKNLSGNLPDLPCNWIALEPNNPKGLLVATDLGVFRCADYTVPESDIYWQPANLGLGWPRVEQIKTRYSDNTVHISTHGRGFFSTDTYDQMPVADFAANTNFACGGLVQFIDSTSNVPMSWIWDFGDGSPTSTVQSPVHQYATSGTYTVSLIVSNVNGTDTASQPFTVTVVPQPVANAGTDMSACPGDTLFFNASGGTSFSWFPTAGLDDPNSATPYHVVSGNRTYVLTVTDANGCQDTDTLNITQLSVPSVWAGQDQTVMFPNDSVQLGGTGADTYLWTPATGLSCTTCPDPKAYPATTTVYTLTGTNLNGCSRSDNATVTVAIVGVDDPSNGNIVLNPVSPNPVADRAEISYQLPASMQVSIDMVDLRGKIVATFHNGVAEAGLHKIQWDRGTLASGMYLLRMVAEDQVLVRRTVVTD